MRGLESATVVIVEDDPSMSRALARILRLGGIGAKAYVSGEVLLASANLEGVGCLIVDVQLPEMSGFELRTRLATMVALPPVIFITAFDSPEARAQALAAGAAAFLTKPFSGRTLLETVRRALDPFRSPAEGGELSH
jgi:FixJ family two-component response regulator